MALTQSRLWTVEEYHRMVEAGILRSDELAELINGQIILMSPQRPPHAATTQYAANYLTQLLADQAYIRVQLPITLTPDSEPEPDVAVVRNDERHYLDHHPCPKEIYLLIEVADVTLESDRQLKAPLYAKAQIEEYWILDVNRRQVYVYRQPGLDGYLEENVLSEETTLNLVVFPDVQVALQELFP